MRDRQVCRIVVACASVAALLVVGASALGAETAAAPGWSAPVIVARPGGNVFGLAFATTALGDKVAVWWAVVDARGPFRRVAVYAKLKRHGQSRWPASPERLSSPDEQEAYTPFIASSPSGRIVVIWASPGKGDRPLRYAILERGATHFTSSRAVPELPGARGLLNVPVGLLGTPDGGFSAVWNGDGTGGRNEFVSASATLAPSAERFAAPRKLPASSVDAVAGGPDGTLVASLIGGGRQLVSQLPLGASHWSAAQPLSRRTAAYATVATGDDGTVALGWISAGSVFVSLKRAGASRFSAPRSLPPPNASVRKRPDSLGLVVTPDGSVMLTYETVVDRDPFEPVPVVAQSFSPKDEVPPPGVVSPPTPRLVVPRYLYGEYVAAFDAKTGRWSSATPFLGLRAHTSSVSLQTTTAGRVIALYATVTRRAAVLRSAQAPAGSTDFGRPVTITANHVVPSTITLAPSPGSLAAFWIDSSLKTATLAGG